MILLLLLFIIILPTKQWKTRRFFFVFCLFCNIRVCTHFEGFPLMPISIIDSKQKFWKRRRELWSAEANTGEKCNSLIVWHSIRKFQSRIEILFLQNYKNVLISMLCDHGSWFMTAGRWDQLSSCTPKLLKNQKKKKSTNQRHQPRLLQIECLLTLQNKQKFLWNCHQVPKCIASIKIALLPHAFVPNESSSSALNITHSKLVYCCSHWILSPNDR